MRVAVDLTSLADNFSGIERYAAELSRALLNIDDKNDYILVFKEGVHSALSSVVNKNNVCIKVLPRGKMGKLLFSQLTLPFALMKLKADIAIFPAFPTPLLYVRKAISTIHDLCWLDAPETMLPKSRIYWKVLDSVNIFRNLKILTVSQFSKSRIVDVYKVPEDKVVVTNCGVDSSLFNRKKAASVSFSSLKDKYSLPDKYILTLSTIEPRKNIPLLIEAWVKACNKFDYNEDLVLAGRKGWKQESLLACVPSTLLNRIHFTGFVDNDDLPALYAHSKLFVFPSVYEGFGLPPVEAAYSGAHVLCSDIPCHREICGTGVDYFKSNDCDDLLNRLLLSDGPHKRCPSVKHYSWDCSAIKLKNIIDNDISKG